MAKRQPKIKRRPIPKLPHGEVQIGKKGIVQRSFDVHKGNFMRLFRGEELRLSITFRAPVESAQVVCHTNLQQADGPWEDLPFCECEGNIYEFKCTAPACGMFGFRIKYSFDGGQSWIWDRAPLVHVHVDPPRMKKLRCYTMLPTVTGCTDQWLTQMMHAKEMGFNMIHLLPVTEMGASESPYSAANLFALDRSFYQSNQIHSSKSGMAAFESFVDAARAQNMSLCIDLVLNHVGPDSQIAQAVPEWIVPDTTEANGLQRSGCWHMDKWLKWNDLVTIDYEHPSDEQKTAIWQYMRSYALFWAYYADLTDGMIRLDNLHNSDEDFIAYILGELRKAYPNLIIHAEFFSDSNTVLKRAEYWDLNLFLANSWEYPYAENLRAYVRHCHDVGNRVPQYMPVLTHDTGSATELFGSPYAIVPRYLVTALMSDGQTGMTQGGEYGAPHKVEFIGRNQPFPYEKNEEIVKQITRINNIHEENPCLRTSGNIEFVDHGHGAVITAFRSSSPTSGLLLFANLDTAHPYELSIALSPITGRTNNQIEDIFYDTPPTRSENSLDVEIPPSGVLAYRISGQ